MKNNFKVIFSLLICFIASFSILLLSPSSISASASIVDTGRVYQATNQSKFITLNNNSLTTKLYNDSKFNTEELYSMSITNCGLWFDNSGNISYSANGSIIEVTGKKCSNSSHAQNPRIQTAFRLPSKFNRAIQNGFLNVSLYAKISNVNASTSVGFQNGSLTGNGEIFQSWSGSGDYTITDLNSISTVTEGVYSGYYKIDFTPTSSDILLVFANEHNSGGPNENVLKVEDPTIVLSSKRNGGTNITNVKVNGKDSDTSWTKENKKLTFNVEDDKIGIDYVTINGDIIDCENISINNDTLKSYCYEVSSIAETNFVIVAYDFLGTPTTLSKLVGFVDSQDVSDINIMADKSYHEKNIDISISFIEDTTHSHDYVFYTLVDNSSFEDTTPDPSDTTGKTKQVNHQNGEYTFHFNFDKDGEYTLTLLIIDEAGHSKLFSHTFTIDSVKRRVNVIAHHGSYQLDGVYEDEQGLYTWSGERVTISYNADENFRFYKLFRNGSEMQTNGSIYNYECKDADIEIEIFNRFEILLNPKLVYEFNVNGTNLEYKLNTDILQNVLSYEELKELLNIQEDLSNEVILNLLNENISNNISFTISKDNFNTDTIFDKGTYLVSWSVDTSNYMGNGNFEIVVNPKTLEIEYLDNNFIYNGNVQNINYKEISGQKIIVKYFMSNSENGNNDNEVEFKNAGNYRVELTLKDENYQLSNGVIFVTINKKEVNAIITNTNFTYNTNEQSIIYTLSEDIPSFVLYYIDNNEQSMQTTFKNAGNYSFIILPEDENNYLINNNSGNCKIEKVIANIKVNKYIYDYTGNVLNLDYSLTANNEAVIVNGLKINYSIGDNNLVEFKEPNTYNFVFTTDDINNYILQGDISGLATIKKTIVKIYLSNSSYEYTGSEINLDYYFVNEDNEHLTSLNNIELKFIQNNQYVDFIECGEYSYEFVTEDKNYELIYIDRTNINIVKAVLNINILNSSYIYNQNGITLNYKITSNNGKDYTNNNNISLVISQNGESTNLNNVGLYTYTFSSNNENIILSSADEFGKVSGIIEIVPKEVIVEVINSYDYTGREIEFKYSLSEDILVNVEVETLLNAGNYVYKITSQNNNYVILNNLGEIIVNPKELSLSEITTNYIFNGENISIEYAIEMEQEFLEEINNLDCLITFSYADNETEIFSNIINANSYKIFITPTNSNFVINTKDIIIVVSPKDIKIDVINNIKTYDKTNKNIDITVEDNIDYAINYYLNGEEVNETINAGIYDFIVTILDSNYTGTISGTFEIKPASLTIQVVSDQYKVYGDDIDEKYDYTLSGLIEGDEIEVNLSRDEGENVGLYQIYLDNINCLNYSINFVSRPFKIIARKLMIIADNMIKEFDAEDGELTYKISYGNLINGDTLQGALVRETGEDVGVYNINLGTLGNNNYQIIFKKATFTIVPSDLYIKLNDISTIYGEELPLSFSANKSFKQEMVTGSIQRALGNNVGEYEINKGSLQSKNYNLIITNGIYTINPRPAQVTAINTQKTYGLNDNLSYVVSELINNDVLQGNISRETGEDAGTYAINLGSLETLNPNYSFTLISDNFIINKASISIVIDDITQIYGEEEKEYTYKVTRLDNSQLVEDLKLNLFRKNSDKIDAGEYVISAEFLPLKNYVIDSLRSGVYTIEKANIIPELMATTTTYNGNVQHFTNTNFPYELNFVYKRNGIEVDSVVNAGTYTVQGFFAGNNNYYPARSNTVGFVVNKLSVCFNLGENVFIYDGEEKFPEYSFDENLGLSKNAITYEFANGINPVEIGEYSFVLQINDDNYEGQAQGIIKITKPFSFVTDFATLECDDAGNDSSIKNLKLVGKVFSGKFNNQEILQACAFEGVEQVTKNHVFTVRMRAKTNDGNVYVYKIDKNNVATEVVVSVEDGYYIFKVDGLDCFYIVTKDIEPMSLIAVASIIGVSIVVLVAIVIAFKVRRNRKKKLAVKMAKNNAEQKIEVNEVDISNNNNQENSLGNKNKKVRMDEVLSKAINNGTINQDNANIDNKNNQINENKN